LHVGDVIQSDGSGDLTEPNAGERGNVKDQTGRTNSVNDKSIDPGMGKIESLDKLLETLPDYNVQPLWTVMDAVVCFLPTFECTATKSEGSAGAKPKVYSSRMEIQRD
jgi:hypothetical protein